MYISVPSFIIPAGRVENVKYLKGRVDEVELLYMSSLAEYDMPDEKEIAELAEIDIRYNIHMPYDRELINQKEWDFIAKFAEKLRPLNALTHTFHIRCEDEFFKGLEWFKSNVAIPVTLENGDDSDASAFALCSDDICLDVGHLILHGLNLDDMLANYVGRIKMFHLHGIENGKDHRSIKNLPESIREAVFSFAKKRDLTVSIEVFNEKDLTESLSLISL